MNKQLMILGFHRSGTSMLAQELKNAGLFIGEKLLGKNASNRDGHFEDYDFFRLHEKILNSQNETWKSTTKKDISVPDFFDKHVDNLIASRDSEYKEWAFKDPRTALFLPYWEEKLKNHYSIIIYRHYEECVNSLLSRSSSSIGNSSNSDIDFWKNPTLAYEMWMNYNQKILRHIEKHPEKTLVVSHSSLVNGFPLVEHMKKKFGFSLDINSKSNIKKELLSPLEFEPYPIEKALKEDLEETWKRLESFNCSVSSKVEEIITAKKYKEPLNLKQILNALNISTKENNFLEKILQEIENNEVEIENKIDLIRKNQQIFIHFNRTYLLIECILKLITYYPYNENLYFIISKLYLKEQEFQLSEFYLLKVFTISKNIRPYFYNNLANFYIERNNLLLATNAIENAIKGNKNNPSFYMTLSLIFYKQNDYMLALNNIDKALGLLENNINAKINFTFRKITILEELNKDESVEKLLSELEEEYPKEKRIKLRKLHFIEQKEDKVLNKEKENKKLLDKLQNDDLFFEKLRSLLSSLDNTWAEKNLRDRLTYHFNKFLEETSTNIYKVSFVVDRLELHYYQAEMLLFSLEKFGKVNKENILVQCLNRVDSVFLNFLEKNNYTYHMIEPYLDGKYSNKLQQLEVYKDKELLDVDGVILLDTDMFVLEPFNMPKKDIFSAKVVDGANPTLDILENIFNEAKLNFPSIINTDWSNKEHKTFASNFNGGFYFIPKKHIKSLSFEWRKWGSWLYERSYLFENPQKAIHVDQVSMSMAIESLGLPYYNLSANYNCPIHFSQRLSSLEITRPIGVLHYHKEVSLFGLLKLNKSLSRPIQDAIIKANDSLLDMRNSEFYTLYRKTLIVQPLKPKNEKEIAQKILELSLLAPSNLKLIFHVGTPKTGTTSLQFFMDKNRDVLLEQGILYAKKDSTSFAPKHQWMVSYLLQNDFISFLNEIKKSFIKITPNTDTIIFSTEGIYNHWWDFSLESKYFLQHFAKYFDINIWVWFRDPISFSESFYKQNIKNPKLAHIKCYGQDWSLEEMLNNKWFTQHLDYVGFILECENLFGKEKICAFEYDSDIVARVTNKLKVNIPHDNLKRENKGLSDIGIELLRVINRYALSIGEKKKVKDKIEEIDSIISKYSKNTILTKELKLEINKLTRLSSKINKIKRD